MWKKKHLLTAVTPPRAPILLNMGDVPLPSSFAGVNFRLRRILVRCRRISLEELRENYDSELVNRQGGGDRRGAWQIYGKLFLGDGMARVCKKT